MANNEQIIDVGLEAEDGDLRQAVQNFVRQLQQVESRIDKIGSSLNNAILNFNSHTKASAKQLAQAERTLGMIEKITKRENLSLAQAGQLQKQLASQRIRELNDRGKLQQAIGQAEYRRTQLITQLEGESSKKTKLALLAEVQLQDHIIAKINSRTAALDRLTASENRNSLTAREDLQRQRSITEQRLRGVADVERLQGLLAASNRRRSQIASRLETEQDTKKLRALLIREQREESINRAITRRIALANKEQAPSGAVREPRSSGASIPSLGTAVGRVGLYGAAAGAVFGLVNAAQQGAKYLVELQDKLVDLQAIAGLSDERMSGLSQTILEVGRNSKFSTLELVGATTSLAQAGFTASEMASALEAVNNLSVATGTDLATSAETMTSAIGAFNLQASEAERLSDAMTAALNRSKLTIAQVGQSIQYVGATAAESNIKFEELIGAAGAMANAGISRGSTIGTGMRQFLVDLQDPSDKLVTTLGTLGLTVDDVNVKTRGFVPVLTTLRDAGFGSAQAYGSLETRAAAAFLTLSRNTDTIYDLVEAQQQMDAAAQAAEVAMDSLSGQSQRFFNLWGEELATDSAGFLSDLTSGLDSVNDSMERYNKTRLEEDEASLVTIDNLRKEEEAATKAGDAIEALRLRMEIGNEVRQMHNDTLAEATPALEHYRSEVEEHTDKMYTNAQSISTVDDAIVRLLIQQENYSDGSRALQVETLSLSRQFQGLSQYLDVTKNTFGGLMNAMVAYRAEAARTLQATAALARSNAIRQQSAGLRLASEASVGYAVQGNPALETALQQLQRNPSSPIALQAYQDQVSGIIRPDRRSIANEIARGYAEYQSGLRSEVTAVTMGEDARFQQSRQGRDALAQLSEVRAVVGGAQGVDIRGALGGNDARSMESFARTYRQRAENPNTSSGDKRNYLAIALELESSAQQLRAQEAPEPSSNSTTPRPQRTPRPDRSGERAQRQNRRNALTVANESLGASKLALEVAYDKLKEPLDLDDFTESARQLYSSFASWAEDRSAAMEQQIKSDDMSEVQSATVRLEVQREIDLKKEGLSEAIRDSIVNMYETLIEAASAEFDKTMQPFEAKIQIAQGTIDSYDRTYNAGNVPDYVRQEQDYQLQRTTEERDRASLAAMLTKIEAHRAALADVQLALARADNGATSGLTPEEDTLPDAEALGVDIVVVGERLKELGVTSTALSQRDLASLRTAMEEGNLELTEMLTLVEALNASLATQSIPSFSTGLQLAAQNYARANNLHRSIEEDITMGLGGAFSQTHEIMNQFWSDMISNPTNAAAAFQSFGNAVIGMLQRMAAEALANQVMSLVTTALGAPTGGGGGGAGLFGDAAKLFAAGLYEGGNVGGGVVNQGISSRDSVLTGLAKGEFVVRKKAVDSLGLGFMKSINASGAEALKGLGSTAIIPAASTAKQEMSVYLVAKDEQPQLGPNDVIAIVDRNILKDGSTRKLIRHVSQGG